MVREIFLANEDYIQDLFVESCEIMRSVWKDRNEDGVISDRRFGDLYTLALMFENLAHRIRGYVQGRESLKEKLNNNTVNFEIIGLEEINA